MTMSKFLRDAYRFHREPAPRRAQDALRIARVDETQYQAAMAKGDTEHAARFHRYPASRGPDGRPWPAVTWQKDKPGHAAVLESPERAGLRFVGRVAPECDGLRGPWDHTGRTGWHADPYGDGGLFYGVVYQLPGRKGHARFVAGYQFRDTDGGPLLDLGNVFESESMAREYCPDVRDHDDARDAARRADDMARCTAEEERQYQTAWTAGQLWSESREAVARRRRECLALLSEMRPLRKSGRPEGREAICNALRAQLDHWCGDIDKARGRMRRLADGDHGELCFWPGSETLREAFNDGAGREVI